MAAVAFGNFKITDRILMSPALPGAAKAIETLGAVDARYLLRHQVGELNRTSFEFWGIAQLVLGLVLLSLLLFGTLTSKKTLGVALVMVILVAINQFAVMPSIVGLGRSVEFADSTKFPSQRRQLAVMHAVFSTFEGLKVLTGIGLGVLLIFSRTDRKRRSRRTPELDEINNPNYSHINR